MMDGVVASARYLELAFLESGFVVLNAYLNEVLPSLPF